MPRGQQQLANFQRRPVHPEASQAVHVTPKCIQPTPARPLGLVLHIEANARSKSLRPHARRLEGGEIRGQGALQGVHSTSHELPSLFGRSLVSVELCHDEQAIQREGVTL